VEGIMESERAVEEFQGIRRAGYGPFSKARPNIF